MRDKVCVRVLMPLIQQEAEVRIPMGMHVDEAAELTCGLLSDRFGRGVVPAEGAGLMLRDGACAGLLLEPRARVGRLVADEVLVDGSRLVLI